MKVLVLRNEQAVTLLRELPHGLVGEAAGADLSDMQGARKNVIEQQA